MKQLKSVKIFFVLFLLSFTGMAQTGGSVPRKVNYHGQ
jgi:hypothetical protein